jgi:hypothetical protein
MATRLETSSGALGGEDASVLLDAEAIARLPRRTQTPGVTTALLWRRGGSHAGVLWLEPGARLGAHTHSRHVHHVWVVEGEMHCLGRDLGPGAYAFVPLGVEHDSLAGPEGATFFYLYLDVHEEPPITPA